MTATRAFAPTAPARAGRGVAFALTSVTLVLGLRANSDGRPSVLALVLAVVGVAAIAWPLTARERGLPTIAVGLLASQLLLHSVFLLDATGRLSHPGRTGWICCPPSTEHPAWSLAFGVQARGGWLLVGVQVLVLFALALWLRGIESVVWSWARTTICAVCRAAHAFLVGPAVTPLAVATRDGPPLDHDRPALTCRLDHRRPARRGPPLPARLLTAH